VADQTAPSNPSTAFDHDSTLVIALELSGKSWEAGAIVPGMTRRPRKQLDPRDMAGLLKTVERWKAEATAAGKTVKRVVLTYEAGRDGFWIARYLLAREIGVHIMHPASIPVDRKHRRAKTDRLDLDMLLRSLLAWLRGEPRACSMVSIPSEAEEDMRSLPLAKAEGPERERERLVSERVALENRIGNLLSLHGVSGFKPRLKKAAEKLEMLRDFAGNPLPEQLMEELRRLLARHQLASEQMKAVEAARQQALAAEKPDRAARRIQMLVRLYGLGLGTATVLTHEVYCRIFRDRQAIASFVGLTGTPFNSGGSEREQGISKNGNPRVRRLLMQLAWRWLRLQPQSELSQWFVERTGGAKGRIRKVMIVAVARKLLIALWRYVETGELPAGAITVAAGAMTDATA
jgi:transposase